MRANECISTNDFIVSGRYDKQEEIICSIVQFWKRFLSDATKAYRVRKENRYSNIF